MNLHLECKSFWICLCEKDRHARAGAFCRPGQAKMLIRAQCGGMWGFFLGKRIKVEQRHLGASLEQWGAEMSSHV